jgi:hypothetical protein
MRLTDEELREVLARAEEIERTSRHSHEMHAELEAVIGAAEEVGLSRPAVERALREVLNLSADLPAPGTLTFATSADGNAYVAEIMSISPAGARVRFLRGGEHVVTPDQLRPCSLIPGERVVTNWPWWGVWTCTVVGYNPVSQRVELTDGWGSSHTCSIAEVWQTARRDVGGAGAAKRRRLWLLGAGLGAGALLASLAVVFVTRLVP